MLDRLNISLTFYYKAKFYDKLYELPLSVAIDYTNIAHFLVAGQSRMLSMLSRTLALLHILMIAQILF